jgi:hypothetical protein
MREAGGRKSGFPGFTEFEGKAMSAYNLERFGVIWSYGVA